MLRIYLKKNSIILNFFSILVPHNDCFYITFVKSMTERLLIKCNNGLF